MLPTEGLGLCQEFRFNTDKSTVSLVHLRITVVTETDIPNEDKFGDVVI